MGKLSRVEGGSIGFGKERSCYYFFSRNAAAFQGAEERADFTLRQGLKGAPKEEAPKLLNGNAQGRRLEGRWL